MTSARHFDPTGIHFDGSISSSFGTLMHRIKRIKLNKLFQAHERYKKQFYRANKQGPNGM